MEKLSSLKEGAAWAENQSTLNKIGEENGKMTFDGQPVGGSVKTNSMFLEVLTDVDIQEGYGSDLIGLMYPTENEKYPLGENSVIIDVGIVLFDGTEIRSSQFPKIENFGADAIHNVFAAPQFDEKFGAYVFFRIFKENISELALWQTITNMNYSGVNVYYLGGN